MATSIKVWTTIEIVDGDRRLTLRCESAPVVYPDGMTYRGVLVAEVNPNFHNDVALQGQRFALAMHGDAYELIDESEAKG